MQGPQHGSTWVPWVRLIQGWPKMELEEERKGAHGAPGACPDRENGSHAGSPHGVPAPHEGTPYPSMSFLPDLCLHILSGHSQKKFSALQDGRRPQTDLISFQATSVGPGLPSSSLELNLIKQLLGLRLPEHWLSTT